MRLDLYANVDTKQIIDAIGLDEHKIPRIRGVGIEDGKILVHTRTGGGNREQYDTAEDFIEGDYGINDSIERTKKALTDLTDYHWHISQPFMKDVEHDWSVPYDAQYRFPETDEEWAEKEAEIKQIIKDLEDEIVEVRETKAYTNEYMTTNKWFISDEDDDFDSTYANFWFTIPPEFTAELEKLEDPVKKAALGDAKDFIEGVIGNDEKAIKRIEKRVKKAKEKQNNE